MGFDLDLTIRLKVKIGDFINRLIQENIGQYDTELLAILNQKTDWSQQGQNTAVQVEHDGTIAWLDCPEIMYIDNR